MVSIKPHSGSKRMTLKQKYLIKKKVTNFHRKARKIARMKDFPRKREAVITHIPNSCPWKLEAVKAMIGHAREKEAQKAAEKQARREAHQAERQALTDAKLSSKMHD